MEFALLISGSVENVLWGFLTTLNLLNIACGNYMMSTSIRQVKGQEYFKGLIKKTCAGQSPIEPC